jgi:hypothetical protein
MYRKGRNGKHGLAGSKHHQSKLTETDVLAIRADPESQRKIAAKYGVTQAMIGLIKQRKNWTHI